MLWRIGFCYHKVVVDCAEIGSHFVSAATRGDSVSNSSLDLTVVARAGKAVAGLGRRQNGVRMQ